MSLSKIDPDTNLREWLEGQITISVSDTEVRNVAVYAQAERPNLNLPEEFVEILYNGNMRPITKPFKLWMGNLAITIYCKSQSNGTAKSKRVKSILSQLEELVSDKLIGKYFYKLDVSNVITPLQVNTTNGYSTMTLGVEWRTEKE